MRCGELASHEHAGAAAVRALGFLEDGVLTLSSLPALVLCAAAGTGFLRERLVPRWFGYLTVAGVPPREARAGGPPGVCPRS